jgi:hypothetical protein
LFLKYFENKMYTARPHKTPTKPILIWGFDVLLGRKWDNKM